MTIDQAVTDAVTDAVRRALVDIVGPRRTALTVDEVAWSLGTSPDTVRRLIAAGHLPLVPHVGTRKLIPVAALEAFTAGASTPATDLPPVAGVDGPTDSTSTGAPSASSVLPLASPGRGGRRLPSTARGDQTPPAA